MLKLAYRYMKYYKGQTFAILASIILTAALLSGISSLMYSSERNDLENSKAVYGDWHYCIRAEKNLFQSVQTNQKTDGFQITQCGRKEILEIVKEPYPIYFVHADKTYMQMTNRNLIEGSYPKEADEIAADYYTLQNLGFKGSVGDHFDLNGKSYVLTGIIKGEWASNADEMELFTGDGFGKQQNQTFLYIKFDENRKLYQQSAAFQKKYHITDDMVETNDAVIMHLGGEKPDSIYDIIRFALTDKDGNFTYIILKLQSEYNLSYYGMISLLCIFSLFVIYSIFNISVSKRTSEYGIMLTLGISGKRIGIMLIVELWILFLIGYPIGCFFGNGVLKMLYQRLSTVFTNNAIDTVRIENTLTKTEQTLAQENSSMAEFHIAYGAMLGGFIFLLAALALIGFFTVYSLQKQTIRQAMSGDTSFTHGARRIYSKRQSGLAFIVVRKFMFSNKRKLIGIILSLAIGGCIFLCTTYLAENLKIHAEMSMKSDDGLGTQYRISIKSDSLSDTISKTVIDEIKKTPELAEAYAVKYTLGELTIQDHELEWDEYFDYQNNDSYFLERFGGICVKKENGTYGIKYDIYGYDAELIEQLGDFVLEGNIDATELEGNNSIIAVANMDGQGNYNFYGKHPGDTITMRVPKDLNSPAEVLKFTSPKDCYIEKKFRIAAIVSRALAQEEHFLNAGVWSGSQSLIMTNRQMDTQFGIADYSFLHASLANGVNTDALDSYLLQIIQDVPKAILQNYATAIKTQKNYLRQQQLFFSGIAVILLVISLFHIMNSVNHSILSRRREYGLLRAMGITDSGFYKMVLCTGMLYGLLADLFVFLIYNMLLRQVMDYYMAHIVQFLHFTASVPIGIMAAVMILNLFVSVFAVIIPAKKIVRANIINEIGH